MNYYRKEQVMSRADIWETLATGGVIVAENSMACGFTFIKMPRIGEKLQMTLPLGEIYAQDLDFSWECSNHDLAKMMVGHNYIFYSTTRFEGDYKVKAGQAFPRTETFRELVEVAYKERVEANWKESVESRLRALERMAK